MKYFILILIFTFSFINENFAQAIDIKNFDLIKPETTTTKPYFIKIETTSCGYCIKMDRETFTDKNVSLIAQEKFQAFKLDANTKSGKEIVAKYKIKGFPTTLFFHSDGSLMGKEVGYLDAIDFIEAMEYYHINAEKSQRKKRKKRTS